MSLFQWIIVVIMALHFIVSTIIAIKKYMKFDKGFELPYQELTIDKDESKKQ